MIRRLMSFRRHSKRTTAADDSSEGPQEAGQRQMPERQMPERPVKGHMGDRIAAYSTDVALWVQVALSLWVIVHHGSAG